MFRQRILLGQILQSTHG